MEILEDIVLNHEQAGVIARGLYTLARIDGHQEREGMLIKTFWMETVDRGTLLDLRAFESMADISGEDLARGLSTPELRRAFLRTAILLAYADGSVSAKERKWIDGTAETLGFDAAEVQRSDELVRAFLLRQLSHVQNVDALASVAKKLGF